jgi:hypothetical protein
MSIDYSLGILPMLFACIFGLIGILSTIFWIWMIIDCATNEPSEGNEKIIWILVIVLVGVIGAIVYYFVRRPERIRGVGR